MKIPFDDGTKVVLYWAIETTYDCDLSEYINENEILCSKYNIKGVIVYLTYSYEDYLLLNSVIKIVGQ